MSLLWQGVILAYIPLARGAGYRSGQWLAPPDPDNAGQRVAPLEPRQGSVCIAAALVTYYGAALMFVGWHHGGSPIEPYMRIHFLDGFGCAALYALIFRHVGEVNPADRTGKGLVHWLMGKADKMWAVAGLTAASAVIAAASVFGAGASSTVVIFTGVMAALILMTFWIGIIAGIRSVPASPPFSTA
jgi:hypothetical protein